MRALVTGGAGFIGSNICQLLAEERHEITVLDNLQTGVYENLKQCGNFRFVHGDVRDPATVDEAIAGCETVFHLAASVGNIRSIADPITDAEINVLGTIRVLEAAKRNLVRKIIVSSSCGIFGEPENLPVSEHHKVSPDSPYGVSKLAQEKLALVYSKLYPMDVVCLRYFNVYGINQRFDAYGNVIPIFVNNILKGKAVTIYGDGGQTRDFVNVRDIAQANLAVAQAPHVKGVFNIGSGTATTINQVVSALAKTVNEPIKVLHEPARPGEVRHSCADISAARSMFNYRSSTLLKQGLAEYVAWARTQSNSEIEGEG